MRVQERHSGVPGCIISAVVLGQLTEISSMYICMAMMVSWNEFVIPLRHPSGDVDAN